MDAPNSTSSTAVSDISINTNETTVNVIILCHIYALLKQWVSEDSKGSNHSSVKPHIGINTDSSSDMEFIFSNADCRAYRVLQHVGFDQCPNTTDAYKYDIAFTGWYGMSDFIGCFLFFFLKEKFAIEKCSNMPLEYANNIGTMTLLAKNQIFYSFMNDTFGLNDVCEKDKAVINVTEVRRGMLTTDNCLIYHWLKSINAENVCTSETETINNGTWSSHFNCIWYRLLTELGTQTFCENQWASCGMYNYVMAGMIGGSISIIGIVCNIGSLIKFFPRVVKSPTIYQLRWLAVVDAISLALYVVYVTLIQITEYLQVHYNFDWSVISPYIKVYIRPVCYIAQTSTNWLTVFIGVYQYLIICKPISNSYRHVERHRRKYVVIILGIAALCNIPYFFVSSLSQYEENNTVYFHYVSNTSFGKSDLFKVVYDNLMHSVCTVCLPFIILLIVTVKMMVVVRKKERNNTPQNNINTVIIRILLTFIICQFPLLVDSILNITILYSASFSSSEWCGSVQFYLRDIASVLTTLNSAVKPFIYIVLRNHFAWLLRTSSRYEKAETIEMSSM